MADLDDTAPILRPAPVGVALASAMAGACLLVLAAASVQSPGRALLVLGAGIAAAGVLAILVFARDRLVDLAFITFIGIVTIPIDKYFAYRDHIGGWPGMRISLADGVLAVLALGALLGWLLRRVTNTVPRIVLVLYTLLLLQYGMSAAGAPEQALAIFELSSAIHAIVICLTIAALFRREYLQPVVLVLIALVVLHTGLAAAQVVTGRPIGVGLLSGGLHLIEEVLVTGSVRLRPSGLFDHPIVFANFLMITLPIIAGIGYSSSNRWLRLGTASAVVIGWGGLALTLSRGAWVSSLAAAVVFIGLAVHQRLLTVSRVRRLIPRMALAIALLAIAFGPSMVDRVRNSNAGNLEVRFALNRIAFAMIGSNPVNGVGLNNFIPAMSDYDPTDVAEYFPATVHNIYLLEGAEAGVPGLVLFVALFIAIFTTSLRRLASVTDPAMRWLAIGVMAGLAGLLLSQMADFSHRLEPLRSMIWTNIGLLFGAVRARRHDGPLAAADPGSRG
jgi:O-antigen ligase